MSIQLTFFTVTCICNKYAFQEDAYRSPVDRLSSGEGGAPTVGGAFTGGGIHRGRGFIHWRGWIEGAASTGGGCM